MGFTGPVLVPQEVGLAVDDPAIEGGRFGDLLKRADLFLFEFGLATQKIDDPVRVGREESPADRRQLKIVERLFRQRRLDRGRNPPQGPPDAAPLHRHQRDLQQVLADLHRLRRRKHQSRSAARCSPAFALAEPVTMKEKILKFKKKKAS